MDKLGPIEAWAKVYLYLSNLYYSILVRINWLIFVENHPAKVFGTILPEFWNNLVIPE